MKSRQESHEEQYKRLQAELQHLGESVCLTLALIHKHEEAINENKVHLAELKTKLSITLAKIREMEATTK